MTEAAPSPLVNNGRVVEVEHAAYTGRAGMVITESDVFLSFPLKGKKLPVGDVINIGGKPFEVVTSRRSDISANMTLLTVKPVEG
jgi:hypothetical protein